MASQIPVTTNTATVTKNWVNSNISLSLSHNPDIVGSGAETVTATVQVDNGDGLGFVAPPVGTVVTLNIDASSNAAGSTFTPGAPLLTTTCMTIANGTCTALITSTGTGTTVVKATSSPLAGPAASQIPVLTNTGSVTKHWVNSNISLSLQHNPDIVGSGTETVTATVQVDNGDGLGFVAAPIGTVVTLKIDAASNAAGSTFTPGAPLLTTTCTTTTVAGTCTVAITSTGTGKTIVDANSSPLAGPGPVASQIAVATNTASVTKNWVNSNISLSLAHNPDLAGSGAETVTATVQVDNGDGLGFVAAPIGTVVTLKIDAASNAAGSTFTPGAPLTTTTCTTTTIAGTCTVAITSTGTGTTIVDANSSPLAGPALTQIPVPTTTASITKFWTGSKLTLSLSHNPDVLGSGAETVTATVQVDNGDGLGLVAAPIGTVVSLTIDGASTAAGSSFTPGAPLSTTTCATTTIAGTCTVLITSTGTGTTVVDASSSPMVGPAGNQIAAPTGQQSITKTWVNSKISLSLQHNPDIVGSGAETVTATVQVDNGDGAGFVAAPIGTVVTLNIDLASTAAGSTFTPGAPLLTTTCTTTTVAGTCTALITSTGTGTTIVDANSSPLAGPAGSKIAVPTGQQSITKTWVNSKITLSLTSSTDAVGSGPETVTATVQVDNGDGAGFVTAPIGTVVTLSIDAASTAAGSSFTPGAPLLTTTCTTTTISGTCTVQITATGTGTTVVDANSTPQAGPASNKIPVPTGNASVVKTWGNAKLTLSLQHNPDISGSGAETVTATVQVDDGAGFVAAPTGTIVTLSIDASSTAAGSSFTGGAPPILTTTCATVANGTCTVQIVATGTGTTVVDAVASPLVGPAGGVMVPVSTGPQSITKTWVNSKISLSLQHNPDALGTGAETVTATVQVDNGDGAGFVAAPIGTVVTLSIDGASTAAGSTFTPGGPLTTTTCTVANGFGTCTVQITSTGTGTTIVDASSSPTAGPAANKIAVPTGQQSITKTWVNSKISLSLQHNPDIVGSGVETVTATVLVDNGDGLGFVAAPIGTTVTLSIDGASTAAGSKFAGNVTSTTCTTVAGGTCTVQITSTGTGTTIVDASASPMAGPAANQIAVPTGQQSITKTWVNSKISLSLQHNPDIVGSGAETVTATVQVDNGDGLGFVAAPTGTTVTLTIDAASSAAGSSFTPGAPLLTTTCTTLVNGTCTVQITSTGTGTTIVDAHASPMAGPAANQIAVPTGTQSITKTWVNSKINLSLNSSTDQVGTGSETVTATVQVDNGDGLGFVPAPTGTTVTLTIDGASTAAGSTFTPGGPLTTTTCTTAANGTCTVQITATGTGTTIVDAHASPMAGPAGSQISVPTGPASTTKVWVNSKINLTLQHNPDVSGSGAETVTATVQVDNGDGLGFVAAPAGTFVTLTIDASSTAAGSTFTPGAPLLGTTCTTAANGTCTVQITATGTGTTVVDAHASPLAGPAANQISTPTGTNSVTKVWVNSKISLSLQHNPDIVGSGAETVTATVQVDNGDGLGFVAAPTGTTVTLFIDAASSAAGSSFTPGAPLLTTTCTTLANGTCTVQITSTGTGTTIVDAHASPMAGPAANQIAVPTGALPITKTWVNSKINLSLTSTTDQVGSGTETVTATVQVDNGSGLGFVAAPAGTIVTLSIDVASTAVGSTFTPGAPLLTTTCTTAANGTCTVLVTAGGTGTTIVDAHASPLAGPAGSQISVPTGPASTTKVWVNSKINLSLPNNPDVSGSGAETVTATVQVDNGNGLGFVAAPAGTVVTLTIDASSTAAGSSFTPGGPLTTTTCSTAANGTCTVQITATGTGTTIVDAHASPLAGPAANQISTPTGTNSVTKVWVSSKLNLSLASNPDQTGTGAETVTATVQVDNGTGTFVPAPDGTVVTLTIDAASTATGSTFTGGVTSTTCTTSGGTGKCTVQINATSTGTTIVDGHASPQAGPAGNTISTPTGPASVTKTWVNSKISLSLQHNPDISGSGAETVTATVQVDNGTGTFVNAPDGTVVTLSIDAASTATGSTFTGGVTSTTCTTTGGTCTVQINATSTGTTVVDAHASPQAGPTGNTIAVPTGTANVTKTWVKSKIALADEQPRRHRERPGDGDCDRAGRQRHRHLRQRAERHRRLAEHRRRQHGAGIRVRRRNQHHHLHAQCRHLHRPDHRHRSRHHGRRRQRVAAGRPGRQHDRGADRQRNRDEDVDVAAVGWRWRNAGDLDHEEPEEPDDRDRSDGELHDRGHEHRHPDAEQRERLGSAVAELQPDERQHPGTRLDGTRRERDLQLLDLGRHRQLHERRHRDGHGLERPDRHGAGLGAGHGHGSDPAPEGGRDASVDLDRQGSEVPAGRRERRDGSLQDHRHEHR